DHERNLQAVVQFLWTARKPRASANLLKVCAARALPVFDTRLIELCLHSDEEVRRRAFCALEQNTHALVREFALKELQKRVPNGSVVGLFINNYREGDEHRILEAIKLPDDPCELHGLLMDVVKVLEKHPEADCSRLGVIGYAMTPCSNCRFHASRVLLNRHAAPDWLKEECRDDADEDCRKLAENTTRATDAD